MSAPIIGGKGRVPLAEAEQLAAEVVALLEPSCERIEVAGSIRRRKPEVGDIEIVCVPKQEPGELQGQMSLFGEPHGKYEPVPPRIVLDAVVTGLLERGVFKHRLDVNGRAAFGTRYKRLLFADVGLDLFSVMAPAQWGVLFTIRTGPSEFSHRLVTPRTMGGWMPAGMFVKNGALYDRGPRIDTPEESDFFAALGLEYVEPEQRMGHVAPRRLKAPAVQSPTLAPQEPIA